MVKSDETKFDAAAVEALALAKASPTDAALWLRAGKALARAGKGPQADIAFDRYFSLRPGAQLVAEAAARLNGGDIDGAIAIVREALRTDPGNVDALRLLAGALCQNGFAAEAEKVAGEAVRLAPDFAAAWATFGAVLSDLNRLDDAQGAYCKALELDPANPDTHLQFGNALLANGEAAKAEIAYRRALEFRPGDGATLLGLGHALKTMGHQEAAITCYKECIVARPHGGEAWWSLANLKTFRFSPGEEATMRRLLAREDLAAAARISIGFALAKAREDAKDFETAFGFYAEANALQRTRVRYDPVQTEVMNRRIAKVFDAEFFQRRAGFGCDDPAPIFIVGLPRSGSTLIEQILASHSLVDGTSELPALARVAMEIGKFRSDGVVYPEALQTLSRGDSVALGKSYLARAARHRAGKPFFTDKMPNNFAHAGLIALILPQAKIIDARRHPMDSCLGAFKQLFARGQTFSYDLLELGHYYLEYDRLMRHWDAALPGRVLRVDYEALVQNQEAETRRLLDYCSLPFEKACLSFHETARAVNTASSEQVRQPIYASALHAWRRYSHQLEALEAQLAPVLRSIRSREG